MEPQDVETILRSLAATMAKQDLINDDLRTSIDEQRAMNARVEAFMQRQDGINERLTAAIERLDTLMVRALRQDEHNGRDA